VHIDYQLLSIPSRPPPRATLFPYTTLFRSLAEISRASGLQIVYADGVVPSEGRVYVRAEEITVAAALTGVLLDAGVDVHPPLARSEEHTSELQSRFDLVCRLLLEKKKVHHA